MPRINADSVAEHVAQQRAAVLEAAVHLFTERGFAEVSLGDIAGEVGLARNSLYRYVPDKVHLLVEWFRAAVPRTIADWEAAVSGNDPAPDRLTRWAHCYLEWARSPEHQLVAPLIDSLDNLAPDVREEVAALHRSMLDVVARTVAEAGVPENEVPATVHLLSGIVLGAARAEGVDVRRPVLREEFRHGVMEDRALRRRLDRAIVAIVS
ncbi:MAG: TetR/AcrR family transcriptional regulator [Acidimicrobiales bacterium]|nr:TetR/AcrR family transcriptional regulator [Acidimicrobiales bacterium]